MEVKKNVTERAAVSEKKEMPEKARELFSTERQTSEAVIYIGPQKRGLNAGTILRGELPENAKRLLKEVPIATRLFVPLSKLKYARMELRNQGSVLKTAYRMAEKAKI